jgi:hypothetical protein
VSDCCDLEKVSQEIWIPPQGARGAVRCGSRAREANCEQSLVPRRRRHHGRVHAVVDRHELAYIKTLSDQRITDVDRMRLRSCKETMLTAGDGGKWAEA